MDAGMDGGPGMGGMPGMGGLGGLFNDPEMMAGESDDDQFYPKSVTIFYNFIYFSLCRSRSRCCI